MDAPAGSGAAQGHSEGGDKRASARDSVLRLWTLRVEGDAGAAPISIRVRNISAGGLMAECDHLFTPAERVALEVSGVGLVRGMIAWSDEDCVGIAFDRAINPKAARRPIGGGMMTSTIQAVPRMARRPRMPRVNS
ncbi:PilZ domain-containing protein [Sphingomonas quercus]|uniref:PilZ domain-containing protein n=1 Tax=Sphingomonas quercus TaxID=2842451 RepID=A0ABS6BDC5_9SPHN|nr:PilZ domain-containing protein [Sphingomonas quercus]MBU3076325.1 PilZ domain-containing protein [Sphingomonas quercus]